MTFAEFEKDNPDTFDATGLEAPKKADFYLRNRLQRAYNAGLNEGHLRQREDDKRALLRAVFPSGD